MEGGINEMEAGGCRIVLMQFVSQPKLTIRSCVMLSKWILEFDTA